MYAVAVAKASGIKTIGLTGKTGERWREPATVSIVVPSDETFKIQGAAPSHLSYPVPDAGGTFL